MSLTMLHYQVPNWVKFNPRSDRANYVWFRMQNGYFSDQRVFPLTDAQKVLHLFLICEASKKNCDEGQVLVSYIAANTGHKESQILKDFNILCECGLLTALSRQKDGEKPTNIPATNERTNETNVTNETLPAGSAEPAVPEKSVSSQVWDAYSKAYRSKYGVEPLRNATVNAQIKALVGRVPAGEVVEITRFYLTHSDWYYVKNRHPVGAMLRDAEKLRTEWATGIKATTAEARSADQMQGVQSQMERVLRGEL